MLPVLFETTNSRTHGSMHFVETTTKWCQRIKYFHSNQKLSICLACIALSNRASLVNFTLEETGVSEENHRGSQLYFHITRYVLKEGRTLYLLPKVKIEFRHLFSLQKRFSLCSSHKINANIVVFC